MSGPKKKSFPFTYGKRLEVCTGIDVDQHSEEPLRTVNLKFLELFNSLGYEVLTITIDWRDSQTVWFYNDSLV